MSPERWKKINEIFQSVVELEDQDEQNDYLKKVCGEDDSLRNQVKTLLAANDEAEDFIAGNAAQDVEHLLTLKNSKTLSGGNLGHYKILSILGSGGMGKVYLAQDSRLNRSIAVKTLPLSFSKEADYVKRFQTEAKAAANLNHPNVATVYSVEETDDNQVFITMEYVDGKPLNELIPSRGLDQRTFLEWFISLADAFAHAHEKGIVHRDIKPGNIMITPAGVPKILDFGLARIDKTKISEEEDSLSDLTKTGQIMGTPTYMSPEQAEGKATDHRTDIFSLGVVMYEAITGEKPFKGDNYASIVSNLLNKEPLDLSVLKPDIPDILSRVIMKCLSKEPRHRYQSMSEIRVLLKEISSAINSNASLTGPNQRAVSNTGSFRSILLVAGIGILGLIGLFGLWNWFVSNPARNQGVTRFSINAADEEAKLSVLDSRISPDGKNLILQTFTEDGPQFYLRSMDKFEVSPIKGTETGRKPFLSPDGKWLAFETKAGSLKKVPIEGGNAVTICENCPTNRINHWGHWGANNIIYYANKKGIATISANGGTPEQLTTIDEKSGELNHYYPQLLPDGQTLMFSVKQKDSRDKLALLSLADKKIKFIEEAGNAWQGKYISTGHIIFARKQQLMAIPFDPDSLQATGSPVLVLPDLFELSPNFQVADNGTLIYLPTIVRNNNQVVWVNRQGEETPALSKKGDFSSPRLSPDGTHIAVKSDSDIWVYNLKSETGIRLTSDDKNEIPMWSTDGKSVFYTTHTDEESAIYRKSADGTGEAEKIHSNRGKISVYSMHPTEDILAFSAQNPQGNSDVITKSLSSNEIKVTAGTRFTEDTPRFSPDGKWLTYFSMDARQPQIYAESWDGEKRKVAVTKNGGMFPVFSANGKELFFRNAGMIYSADVKTSPDLEIFNLRSLFKGKYLTSFDVSSDGQRLLMVKDAYGTLPRKMNIILNWTEELKQIVKDSR